MAVVVEPTVTVNGVAQGLGSPKVSLANIPLPTDCIVVPESANPSNWNLLGYLFIVGFPAPLSAAVVGTLPMQNESVTYVRHTDYAGTSMGYAVFVQCPPWVVPQAFHVEYDDGS